MRRPFAVGPATLTTAAALGVALLLPLTSPAAAAPTKQASPSTAAARPTNPDDPRGDAYTTKKVKSKCSAHVCVHWVNTTVDKPPAGQPDVVLTQMNKIWKFEVNKLGFRAPLPDGKRGGNKKLDVYLKDVGSKGYAGYCTKDKKVGNGYLASAYCVLDNDFRPDQFDGHKALNTLRATAAHELFHAIQLAYDSDEDAWLVESTATWMEERYADKVNDNRKYLPSSQIALPWSPLDMAGSGGTTQFGNWIWWEYLTKSRKLGDKIVRTVWENAGEYKGGGGMSSTRAVVKALKKKGTFNKLYRDFAAANTTPAKTYEEGAAWPVSAPMDADPVLTSGKSTGGSLEVDHLASRHVRIRPGSSVTGANKRLLVKIDGPSSKSAPAAVVQVRYKSGKVTRKVLALDADGKGKGTVLFDASQISSVIVTVVNASTRFDCWTRPSADPAYSCTGNPRDDNRVFTWSATSTTA